MSSNTQKNNSRRNSSKNNASRQYGNSRNNKKNTTEDYYNETEKKELKAEFMLWIVLIINIILLLCVFNLCGPLSNVFGSLLFGLFGSLAYIFPIVLFLLICVYHLNSSNKRITKKVICSGILYIIITAIFELLAGDSSGKIWNCYTNGYKTHVGGGFIGGCISRGLSAIMGNIATGIILFITAIMLIVLITGKLIASIALNKGSNKYYEYRENIRERRKTRDYDYEEDYEDNDEEEYYDDEQNNDEEDIDDILDNDFIKDVEPKKKQPRRLSYTFPKEEKQKEEKQKEEKAKVVNIRNETMDQKTPPAQNNNDNNTNSNINYNGNNIDNINDDSNNENNDDTGSVPIYEQEIINKFGTDHVVTDNSLERLVARALESDRVQYNEYSPYVEDEPVNNDDISNNNERSSNSIHINYPDSNTAESDISNSDYNNNYNSKNNYNNSNNDNNKYNIADNEYSEYNNQVNSQEVEYPEYHYYETNNDYSNAQSDSQSDDILADNDTSYDYNDNFNTSNDYKGNFNTTDYNNDYLNSENYYDNTSTKDYSDEIIDKADEENDQIITTGKTPDNNDYLMNGNKADTNNNINNDNNNINNYNNNINNNNTNNNSNINNNNNYSNNNNVSNNNSNNINSSSQQNTDNSEDVNIEMPPEPIPYIFPSIDLLENPSSSSSRMTREELEETARKLQDCLKSFKVEVTMTDIICGPTVTRYELQPSLGTRVKKITELENDIKLNLAAADIRIEAPIPGKSAVGIEVPNPNSVMIPLRDMMETKEFRSHGSNVAFAVGKDIGGNNIVADIAKMPHMLIAGSTGSGKSVCINTIVMSILYKADPNDVKLIMVDPKVVELSVYNGIPHLCIPVVTDPKKAAAALNWAVAEMNDRYRKFAELGVRDMKGFNKKIENMTENPNMYVKMPQIVIIVDELADLMMVASHDVETAICRLAQMARAAGIHLIIATQRPSVDVITGLIKANVPSRIAFAVSSAVDSRTILDGAGAEKLLGKGDMLFFPQGMAKPIRVQGAFVSDAEVARVTDFVKGQYSAPVYDTSISEQIANASANNQNTDTVDDTDDSNPNGWDEKFEEAGRFIIEKQKASIGTLQRVFKIGFNRGARIMDQLCEAGVVSDEEGKKPRNILMTMEEFDRLLEEGRN